MFAFALATCIDRTHTHTRPKLNVVASDYEANATNKAAETTVSAAAVANLATSEVRLLKDKCKKPVARLHHVSPFRVTPHSLVGALENFRTDGYVYLRGYLSANMRETLLPLVHALAVTCDIGSNVATQGGSTMRVDKGIERERPPPKGKIFSDGIPDFVANYTPTAMSVVHDARLLKLVRVLMNGTPEAIHESHVYFRVKTATDHTAIHADWGFFAENVENVDDDDNDNDDDTKPRRSDEWTLLTKPVAGEPLPFFTVWLPLTPCGPHNTGLILSPRSHTSAHVPETKKKQPHYAAYPRTFDPAAALWSGAHFELGDVLVFEARTIHGAPQTASAAATANASRTKRHHSSSARASESKAHNLRASIDFRVIPRYVSIKPDTEEDG